MSWIDRLPEPRGRLSYDRALDSLSWLRTGGAADVLFQPADVEDLQTFMRDIDPQVPVFPIGVCSNLIIRDGGIEGVVIRLGRGFNGIEITGQTVTAGAAALDAQVAKRSTEAGVDLTFLRTIPGTIGGAVTMNAGCYGTYTADVLESARCVLPGGDLVTLSREEIGFGYRNSSLPEGAILIDAVMTGPDGDPDALASKMEDALAKRAATQPVDDRSCGSTFRNPAGFSSSGRADDVHDLKAWKLIEDAGMRGARLGGAQMSTKHANFLINTGDATSHDLETLGEDVRKKVFDQSGIALEWEIKRVGRQKPI